VPASYGQPVSICTPSPSVRGHLVYPGAYARRRACPPLYRGRAHPSVSFSGSTIPEPALQLDKFPVNVQPIYLLLWRVMWTTPVSLLCTGCEWCSRS
jgi:hypothetical protein